MVTKIGMQSAPPFTFLTLRFAFGIACMALVVLAWRPRWPSQPREWLHLAVAGFLMHPLQLGGSHYAQYLGMSAGVAALVISCQPLLTATIASRWMGERLVARQWLGVALGLLGVALVVWHKIDIREVNAGSLGCTLVALGAVTAATLYQRRFCPDADLKAAAVVQFAVAVLVLAPLAVTVEDFRVEWTASLLGAIAFLVIGASILAVSALYLLLRHGEATRVTSMMYLPPVFAVGIEMAVFGVVPSALAFGGMALTCLGVGLAVWRSPRAVPAPAAD